ncbi:coiled-coil domain-containing protein 167 isoform X2 [Mauremys reevesii]|uniref:coiled-coil domain-containing protein 167 isoform X2 n=1 Tax=Mauremys reevesii TaxID=260615 RepID=UPI0019402076|nr:coiled-coil domain-containing protein 167 isoform X2 [Mauremys reevesii]
MAAAAPQNDGICVKAYPSQRWQLKSLPGERVHTCPLTERGRARAHAHSGAKRRKMVKKREGLSVAQEIDGLEEKLSLCRQSMEEVDLKLLREELSPEGRKSLERERSLLVTKAETYDTTELGRSPLSDRACLSSPSTRGSLSSSSSSACLQGTRLQQSTWQVTAVG